MKVGQGPGLVFVHGLTNNWYGWGAIAPYIAPYFTMYIPDLPGYGDSEDLDDYSIEIQGEYLVNFMEELPEFPVGIVGISMGSSITGELGRRVGERLQGIVLAGPTIKKGRTVALFGGLNNLMRLIGTTDTTTNIMKRLIATRWLAHVISKYMNMYNYQPELVDEYGIEGKQKMRAKTYPPMSVSVSTYDLMGVLKDYQYPALMIYGKQDRVSSPKYAYQELIPEKPNLHCIEVDEAGHWVTVEKPAQVAEAIVQFFNHK